MAAQWIEKLARRLPYPLFGVIKDAYPILKNLRGSLNWLLLRRRKVQSLALFERRWYSQNWEDGILQIIFYKIGITNRFCVEFGVEDGRECNSRYLIENRGWSGLLMDGGEHEHCYLPVRKEFITAENINELFAQYNVPREFDLLSIDIDGNDYWVWKAIKEYSPRAVVIEYNASLGPSDSKTIPYDPDFRWDGTNFCGASLLALYKLGRSKGYTLLGCDSQGVNAFFVRDDAIDGHFNICPPESVYEPPRYGKLVDGKFLGHRPSEQLYRLVDV